MSRQRGLAAAVMLASAAAAGAPPDTTLNVGPDEAITVLVNGQAAAFRIATDRSSIPILNPDAAARLGLKPGFITIGARVRVGPSAIDGQTVSVRSEIAGIPIRQRVAWFDRPIAADADGEVGPGGVPQYVISFQLRPAGPEERTVALTLADRGHQGLGTQVSVGGIPVFVQWDVAGAASTATAAAAADLAAANGAAFVGAAWQEPIRFGILRPVRRLHLQTPFRVGPIAVGDFVARVSDYGDSSHVPEGDSDDNEIVVTGKGRKDQAIHRLVIGRDDLSSCSQISFDKISARVILTCAP